MKRFAALILTIIMMIQLAVAAVAVEPEDVRGLLDESVPCTSQSDGLWALLSRKWQDQNSATLFASGPGLIYSYLGHTMPTTGEVRPLVLPIDFPDMKMTESEHERLVRNLYAENDPEKSTDISSAKAQLYRHSYGKLNLVGDPDKDILPVYTAPENRDYYIKENSSKLKSDTYKWIPLINTALASYFDDDPERDYADYDADGDGCIDALIIWSATHTNAFFDPVLGPESGIKINHPNVKSFNRIEIGPWMMGPGVIAHELGHAMGLDEAYEPRWCEIPHVLEDLMGSGGGDLHLNVFSRYILNWVDPLVITASDPVQSIDLYSADWYGGEFDDSKPRAIVLIPENKDLPLTEFYMVEYRPNEATRLGDVDETYPTLGEQFPNQPGVLIWHCDTEWDFDYYQFFVHQDRYRLPVYRSGDTSSFSYEDFYTTGTVFSPETTPNSAFYDGTETGIYVEVVQADGGEYAKLNVGFLDILPPEAGGEGVITASDVTADSAVLSWTVAQDKQTGADDLAYTLYRSDSDELDTVEQCEAATPVAAGAGLTASTVNDLEAGNTYYFNVVVEDQAGNKATYEKVAVTTAEQQHTHDWSRQWSSDADYHWRACTRCGAVRDKDDHLKNSGTVTKEPTVLETGAKRYNCRVCGCSMYTEELPKLDHTHDFDRDGICTVCEAYQPAQLAEEVYEIANAGNLAWFRDTVNADNYTISGKLTHDVDLSAVCGPEKGSWTPIGTCFFSGVFDGQGHTVSGLYINAPDGGELGLFGCLGEGYLGTGPLSAAAIRNLTVSGSVSGKDRVGGICGLNDAGTIENCTSAVTVRGTWMLVGGIVGSNDSGVVKYCVNTGAVTGGEDVGGIAGNNMPGTAVIGTIESCINTGTVTSSNEYVGGICGGALATFLRNCYNIGSVSGPENYTGAITGCFTVPAVHADHAELSNCFYLSGTADVGIGADPAYAELNGDGEATEMTAEAFASGQVAYLLVQGDAIWGQTIGVDDSPVLGGLRVYYEYTGADCTEKGYTNTSGGQPGEHVWDQGAETVPAGCEDAGEMTYTCTACGQTRTEGIEALGHSYGGWTITQDPTMTETGEAERVCAHDARHKDAAPLPPLTDTAVWTPGQRTEPTDTKPGAQGYTSPYGAVSVAIPKLEFGLSYTGGAARVTAARGGTYQVIFAVYNGEEMTGCAVAEALFPAAGTKDVDASASLAPGEGETVRVFLLSEKLRPLAPAATAAK